MNASGTFFDEASKVGTFLPLGTQQVFTHLPEAVGWVQGAAGSEIDGYRGTLTWAELPWVEGQEPFVEPPYFATMNRATVWPGDLGGDLAAMLDDLIVGGGSTGGGDGGGSQVIDPRPPRKGDPGEDEDGQSKERLPDEEGNVHEQTFDKHGNLVELTDPAGNTTKMTYDGRGLLLTVVEPTGVERSYEYDDAGNCIEKIDALGRVTEYVYNDANQLTHEKWFENDQAQTPLHEITFTYEDGRLKTVGDAEVDYTFNYDEAGRLYYWNVAHGTTPVDVQFVQFYESTTDRREQVWVSTAGIPDYRNVYAYDTQDRITRIEQSSLGFNDVADKRVDFEYNALGQFASITRYADLTDTYLVAQTQYTYDDRGRLTDLEHAQGATPLAGYAWQYDDAGRIARFTISDATTSHDYDYTYDKTNQLTGVALDDTAIEAYEYDANGNRTDSTVNGVTSAYTTQSDNQLETVTVGTETFTYTYDAEGNTTARFIDEGNGDLGTGDTEITEYTWDHRNRLTHVVDSAIYGGDTTQEVEYSYDYLNRLVGRTIDPDGTAGGDPATTEYFVYDTTSSVLAPLDPRVGAFPSALTPAEDYGQIVLRIDATGAPTHRYLWGPGVDQIIADEEVDTGAAEDIVWTLTDHQNNVRDHARYDTATGLTTIEEHIDYDAFGKPLSPSGVDVVLGSTGRLYDEATGLRDHDQRWYDVATARWLSQDPIAFAAGDANLYRYCGNDPVNAVDPTGLMDPMFVESVRSSRRPPVERKTLARPKTPAERAIAYIESNRDKIRQKIILQVADMLENHWSCPKALGKPKRDELENVGRIVADKFINAVIVFLKEHPGARPELAERSRWSDDAKSAPWCADWAAGMRDVMTEMCGWRNEKVPIGLGTLPICRIITFSYAQEHVPGSWKSPVYEHNFVIAHPTGYDERKLPVKGKTITSHRRLVSHMKNPCKPDCILVFDPWPTITPEVYPCEGYNLTNRGIVEDPALIPHPEFDFPPNKCVCFAPGTPVWSDTGLRPIESIRKGDIVLTVDRRGSLVPTRVRALDVHEGAYETLRLTVGGTDVLHVTENHFFFDGSRWIPSQEIALTGEVLTATGHCVRDACCIQPRNVVNMRLVYNVRTNCDTYLVGNWVLLSSGRGRLHQTLTE